MSKLGFTLNIAGLERQIEQKKIQILLGVNDGFRELLPILEGRMQFYMQTYVYDAYFSGSKSPNKYERTYKLLDSIRGEVVNNTLYIYSGENIPYAGRVLKGNDEIPYDFPFIPAGSTGDFRPSRDWITPTQMEIIEHFRQGGEIINIMVQAIQRRI